MKLEFLSFEFDKFAAEMQNLKDKKGFDYLVTIVGEDFGAEEGLGCVYILENTQTHERCSVRLPRLRLVTVSWCLIFLQ